MSDPKVADAKAIAKKYGKAGVIILHFMEDGKFGYASYGKDKERCSLMRKVADSLFEAITQGVWEEAGHYVSKALEEWCKK